MQVMCSWSLDLMFKSKLKSESGNWKIQYGCQAAILKVTLLKIYRLPSLHTSNLSLKFGLDIQSQINVIVWNLEIQYGRQSAILKVKNMKIHRFWPMATNNMNMKFETEIPKQTWVTIQKVPLQSPDTEKSNMAARQWFWKWHNTCELQLSFVSFYTYPLYIILDINLSP